MMKFGFYPLILRSFLFMDIPRKKIDEYKFIREIGRGGFGSIYEIEDIITHKHFACKVENRDIVFSTLGREAIIMNHLPDKPCFGKVYEFISDEYGEYLIIELLGPSLDTMRNQFFHSRFTYGTAIRLAIQMLSAIKELHIFGYIHCDIKPSNFLLRPGNSQYVTLIDFGLSSHYYTQNGDHIVQNYFCPNFQGTPLFCSPNAHLFSSLSRRDDLYSWFYSLIQILSGKLPWEHYSFPLMYDRKMKYLPSILGKQYSKHLENIGKYIETMTFSETPNYSWMEKQLYFVLDDHDIFPTTPFNWEKFGKTKILKFSPIADLPIAKSLDNL